MSLHVAAVAVNALDRLAAKLVIVHMPFRKSAYPLFKAIDAAKIPIVPMAAGRST